MRNISIIIMVIVLACCLLILNPIDLFHKLRFDRTVYNILSDPAVIETIGDEDEYVIQYLGGRVYQVKSDFESYLLRVERVNSRDVINIYEHKLNMGTSSGY